MIDIKQKTGILKSKIVIKQNTSERGRNHVEI